MRHVVPLLAVALVFGSCARQVPPTVTTFTPASGPVGEIVQISGANLGEVRAVSFNGVSASLLGTAASRVLAKVPQAATSGPITVMSDVGSATTTASFVVTVRDPSQPASEANAPAAIVTATGYSLLNVPTSRGTFSVHVIKERLGDATVRTLTASPSDCGADCPVKPLGDYARETGAYAAMNGTYLCPPDYAECAGKVNSFDYAVYNSALGTWINARALNGQNGLVTFAGREASFYRRSASFLQSRGLRFPVTAGLSMTPLLLEHGEVVDSEAEQSPAQKQRSMKGALGVDGTHVYLALVANASVTETAYALRALGVREAINLDGGGTSAMWIGGAYKVGPGRLLPNAIVLTKP